MASNTKQPATLDSHDSLTTGHGVNRKKQKRRAKLAAKTAQHGPTATSIEGVSYNEESTSYAEDEYDYSDGEVDDTVNGNIDYSLPPPAAMRKRNKKKGKRLSQDQQSYDSNSMPAIRRTPSEALNSHKSGHQSNNIWNTSTQQERQNIKEFWLSLSEDERKSLLKIEKEAVLRKMKQQQKHSCSCTVCGRKRTAIEEELEVLYEGYYEELEQYAHHDHPPLPMANGMMPDPLQHRPHPHPLPAPSLPTHAHHKTSHLHEHLDEEEYSEEEDYSEDDDEDYTDEEPEPPRGVPDFFNFGQNLTVKDNLLTVADDLLKNDGRKFIEMMEQLAERRMQRETEAEYAAAHPGHGGAYPPNDPAYNVDDSLAPGEEYDEDEMSYDSQEEYEDDLDEEDEMGGLTEEQRMQEGRRMFQIFAARMFEQRVLTAYREKVAAERQKKLLEELEDETKLEAQRAAKKERDAQKKKDKKKQQQLAKAEEKARKDAEKAAEEARAREVEEQKQEELRKKREEQKRKREEEKRKEAEDRAKKDAEKARRVLEEQQRREEAERKAREQKAAEKARKDEVKKREREEREVREKEAREKKAQDERERREQEIKARPDKDAKTLTKAPLQASIPTRTPQIQKRPSQAGLVAIPGLHPPKIANGLTSPHPAIATPALPKAPIQTKSRQPSQQGPHTISPRPVNATIPHPPVDSSSPTGLALQHATGPMKTIMHKPVPQQQPVHQHSIQASSPLPQGMHSGHMGIPHGQLPNGTFGMPPMGFPGFHGPPNPMMHTHANQRGPLPVHPYHLPPMGIPNRMGYSPGVNGMPAPPPGMLPQHGRGMGFPFDVPSHPPPGFGPHHPLQTPPQAHPMSDQHPRPGIPAHSRQPSLSEKDRFEATVNQPIARPAPIQRPGSVRPNGSGGEDLGAEVDDLSNHLGSSALLADDDEPLPSGNVDVRRSSNIPVRGTSGAGLGQLGGYPAQASSFGTSAPNWGSPTIGFGPGAGLGQQSWGSLPGPGAHAVGVWSPASPAFPTAGGFGNIGAVPMRPAGPGLTRPLIIRLALCQACRQLGDGQGSNGDGFHDVHSLLRKIEMNRPQLDSAPTFRELEDICETEGDNQNGGGELLVRKNAEGAFAIKWVSGAGNTPDQSRGVSGLGEIGSPMPSKTSPAGFGAPGMGRGVGLQAIGVLGGSSQL